MTEPMQSADRTRREVLQGSSALVAGAALTPGALAAANGFRAQGRGDDELRIALIGCGGRGTGAASQALSMPETGRLQLRAGSPRTWS